MQRYFICHPIGIVVWPASGALSPRWGLKTKMGTRPGVYTPGYLLTARWAFKPWDEECNHVAVVHFWHPTTPALRHRTYNRT